MSAKVSGVVTSDPNFTNFSKLLSYPLVVADASLPPTNGSEVLRFVGDAFTTLGCVELQYVEFCRPLKGVAAGGRVQMLLDVNKDKVFEAGKAKAAQVKKEEDAKASGVVVPDPADAAAYTPPSFEPLACSIFAVDVRSAGVGYEDPLNKNLPESVELARARILAQRLLEAVLVNHLHVIKSCAPGNIADMVARLRSLCAGDPAAVAMDLVAELVDLSRSPPKPWSVLASRLCQLQVRLLECSPALSLGVDLIAAHALRALSHFPELQVELSMLHKRSGPLSLAVIVSTINKAVDANPALGGTALGPVRGFVARVPYAPGKLRPVCFTFRDTGRCRRGSECKFSHDAKDIAAAASSSSSGVAPGASTGVCYECGSTQHGVHECVLHAERKGMAKLQSRLSAQDKELVALKAALGPAPPGGLFPGAPVVGAAASLMSSWGFDDDLRAMVSGGAGAASL